MIEKAAYCGPGFLGAYVAFFCCGNKMYCADFVEMICLQYRPYCGKLILSKIKSSSGILWKCCKSIFF